MLWRVVQRLTVVAGVLLALGLLASGSASAASAWRWSAAQIDTQASVDAGAIYALSCPAVTLCVAADNQGNILTSTDPSGGRGAWASASVEAGIIGLPWINGISCPSTGLCVGVDQSGAVLTSTDPTGGSRAWKRVVVSATPLAAIACPSAADCVAVGAAQALSSAAPTGGADAWQAQTIDPKDLLTAVSCPSVSFCAAVDDEGNVLTSPGTTGPWTSAHVSSRALLAISCTSAPLCVASDDDGNVWTSTAPGTASAAWQRASVSLGAGTRGLACVAASLCVAGTLDLPYSTDPSNASSAWVESSSGMVMEANAISCVSLSFCVAGGGGGVSVSTSPTTGTWTPAAQIDGAPTLFGVSCPNTSRCYAGDDSGHIFLSMRPAGGGPTWKVTGPVTNTTGAGFYGLACPTPTFCVSARDQAPIGSSGSGGFGAFTRNPAGPVSGWKPIALLRGPDPVVHGFFNAGCAGTSLCAITWDSGALSISTTPGNAHSWRKVGVSGRHPGVYCPRTGRCVAPGGSCPTRSFCAVLVTVGDGTGSGTVSVSNDPARGSRGGWRSLNIDSGRRLTAISCASARRCLAVDASGRILGSSRPTIASSWRVLKTVKEPLEAISCPSAKLCLVVGEDGIAVTGVGRG